MYLYDRFLRMSTQSQSLKTRVSLRQGGENKRAKVPHISLPQSPAGRLCRYKQWVAPPGNYRPIGILKIVTSSISSLVNTPHRGKTSTSCHSCTVDRYFLFSTGMFWYDQSGTRFGICWFTKVETNLTGFLFSVLMSRAHALAKEVIWGGLSCTMQWRAYSRRTWHRVSQCCGTYKTLLGVTILGLALQVVIWAPLLANTGNQCIGNVWSNSIFLRQDCFWYNFCKSSECAMSMTCGPPRFAGL